MLEKTVSRDDPQPLYKQVKARLLEALTLGDMPPQGKLASERELVARYGVSRITTPCCGISAPSRIWI